MILAWGDSSLANIKEHGDIEPLSTQAGVVVGVAHRKILKTGHGIVNLISFTSRKL